MSDLSMYEFEDIAWDEFCHNGDHIVPHPSGEKVSEHSLLGDSRKKPRREIVGVSNEVEDSFTDINIYQEKERDELSVMNNKRKTMLEKDLWSQTPDGGSPSPCDSETLKEVSSLAFDGAKTLTHCYKSNNMNLGSDVCGSDVCASDATLNDTLNNISQTDVLNFFDSSRDDKDSAEFMYYGWPDIGNFEDVDRIFSCDSTFGLGANNEDELVWFSSSDAVDVLKSEFKFSCPDSTKTQNHSENCEPLRMNDTCSINAFGMENSSVCCKDGSWLMEQDKNDALGHFSFVNQTSRSNRKGDFMPLQQGTEYKSEVQNKIQVSNHTTDGGSGMMNVHKKQTRQQNQSDGKRSDHYLSDGTSFCHSNNSLQSEDSMLPCEATSRQGVASIGIHQQKQATGHRPFSYLQSNVQYRHSDCINSTKQASVYPSLTAVKAESSGLTSASPKESYSSNQGLSANSSRGPSFQVTPVVPNEKRDSIHHQQVFQSPFSSKSENVDMGVKVPLSDPVSVKKNVQRMGIFFENRGDIEGVPGEVGSSTIQESSSVSSVLDEISLEAASFRQLQLVMEQLDLRTKLCIRDSLYRLARSAEQRHNHENPDDSCCGDDRDTSGVLVAEGSNKCTGLMDMETDTNPIDRSIAHLLFHRPSDSSAIPPQESLPYKTTSVDCLQRPKDKLNVMARLVKLMSKKHKLPPEQERTVDQTG